MRVLHVIETLGRGGAEQALTNLLPALQNLQVECHVAVLRSPHDLVSDLEKNGVIVHCLDIGHRWNIFQAIIKIIMLCRRNKYDLLHAHMFFAGIYSALSKVFSNHPKLVVSFHNLDYDSYPADVVWKKGRKLLDQLCMRFLVDASTAVSNQVKEHYEHHLKLNISKVIPNCIPTPESSPIESIEMHGFLDGRDGCTLIIPGRLVHEKGHFDVLKAMKLLLNDQISCRLLCLGDGPLRDDIQQEIENLGLSQTVLLHPAVKQSQLFSAVEEADICVFASTHEGWGLAAAECMALGKPVIATRIGGFLEIIKDRVTGLLVEPSSPDDIAYAIRQMLDDRSLTEALSKAGKESIEERYQPCVIGEKLHSLYQETLAQ